MIANAVQRRLHAIRQRFDLGLELDRAEIGILIDLVECGLAELGQAAAHFERQDPERQAQSA